ncbi:MAG: diphthine synthase [Candidatus Anstonellaceae archaeon]
MGMLVLVGLGISDEKGMPLAGLEELSSCEEIFAESYTSLLPQGTLARLEKMLGKKIHLLKREEVESEKRILLAASSGKAALIVPGDPLIATTHISLLISAKKAGIHTKVVHASSILSSAIGESGLQVYKFGKPATIAFWRENYKPMAAYETIKENLERGLHTLLFLDVDEKLGPMKPSDAAELLLEMEKKGKAKILSGSTKVVLLEGVGWSQSRASYLRLSELTKLSSSQLPCILIVHGRLHFLEEEYLSLLS